MANLRTMVDGVGSLQLNVTTPVVDSNFKLQQEVVIKKPVGFGGKTSEVIVGRILAMTDETATVSVQKPGAVNGKITVPLNSLSPVTESFKRSSVQFSPAYRGRV